MIPYTAEAYAGLMAHYGAAIWPLQLAALLLALAALWLASRRMGVGVHRIDILRQSLGQIDHVSTGFGWLVR